MASTARGVPFSNLSPNQVYTRGRQLPVEYIPTHHASSASPQENRYPPMSMVQSLKSLQQLFQGESEFQSVRQQLSSQSPVNTSTNYYSQSTQDQQFLTVGQYQLSQQSQHSQASKQYSVNRTAQKPNIPKQGLLKKDLAESIVKQYLSPRQESTQASLAKPESELSKQQSQHQSNPNTLSAFSLEQQSRGGSPQTDGVWKSRYMALQDQLGQKVVQLENELATVTKRCSTSQETISILQADKALLLQQQGQQERTLETYKQTMKKMTGQLDQYERTLANFQKNMSDDQPQLRAKLQKQDALITVMKKQMNRFVHLDQDLPQLVLVKEHLDKVVALLKGQPDANSPIAQIMRASKLTDHNASESVSSVANFDGLCQVPVDQSIDISQNEQPNRKIQRCRGVNPQGMTKTSTQSKIKPLERNESSSSLSEIIRKNLQQRNLKR